MYVHICHDVHVHISPNTLIFENIRGGGVHPPPLPPPPQYHMKAF